MKQLHIALGALALAATLSTQTAKADTFTFTWGDANTGTQGSGIMAGSEVSAGPFREAGEFLITSITGTVDGLTITGMLPVNAPFANPFGDGFVGNNNLLFFAPGSPTGETDVNGIAFSLSDGEIGIIEGNLEVFADADSISEPDVPVVINDRTNPVPNPIVLPPNPNPTPTPTPTPSPVPEPSSICLLGTGVLGVAGMVRRRLAR